MKKTLLIATILTPFFLMNTANAALSEASIGSGGGGLLAISGSFVNTTPLWGWEIPAETAAAVQDWTIDKTAGVAADSNTQFDFTSKGTLYILDGITLKASVGGPSILPQVEVGGVRQANGTSTTVIVKALGSNGVEGTLGFETLHATAISQRILGNANPGISYPNDSVVDVAMQQRVKTALENQILALGERSDAEGAASGAILDEILAGRAAHTSIINWLTAASSVSVSEIKLSFPTATIPATWTASLPITITMS
ncbi:hypothetical protein C0Z01_18390 [Photobacterium kishitanii]|uniref:F4 family fimbrial subunit n=2 Tax=Photobacterium kishitanii TaxID=318456 RepID=UPI0007EFA785|nr:hypothetical protein [Photobacterium kishitanii]OBU27289.1 hypothetical protein AYY22_03365 [Photobacterium kishitanii]PSW67824.1 hypothetical protein C0Z01_18390 [Photobacterium kishitanii]